MTEDQMRYDILAQEALRGVVRKVLTEVAKTGLRGEHHFFISFLTRAPGVRLSEKLLGQYDKEMTIVIQNQYWDLKVTETGFEVGLSFDGIPETLVIPFSAVKGFFDPSVQFGLQFDPQTAAGAEDEAVEAAASEDDGDSEPSGEKVVSLDAFRKKP
ncbi:MAG: SspB family protein [Candidatus Devosia euplotis]|nr:SspB family protein [Candidatus Devosia euplotis]